MSKFNYLHKDDLVELEAQVHCVLALADYCPEFLVHDAIISADLPVVD
jgi:hypothetical protein